MVVLEPVQLTGSGRPVLLPAEVEHLLLDRVDLEFEPHEGGLPGRQAKAYKNGYVIATSHRLLWMEASGGQGAPPKTGGFFSSGSSTSGAAAVATASGASARHCALPVHAIKTVNKRSQFSLSGPKVRLHIDVSISSDSRPDARGSKTIPVALRCRGDDPDALAAKLSTLSKTALPSHHHPSARPAPPPPPPAQPTPPPMSVPPPPPTQVPPAPPQPAPRVDPDMLVQLMDMGFPRNRAARALAATGSSDLQGALDFILAFGHLPEMDQPLPDPARAAPPPQHAPIPLYPPPHPAAAAMPPPQQLPPTQQSLPWLMGPPQQVLPGRAYPSLPTQAPAPPLQQHYSSDVLNPLASSQMQQGSLAGAQSTPPSGEGSKLAGGIGIGGIVRREQQKSSQAGQSLSAAFQDLSALMAMAEDMVALANRFRAVSSSNASEMGSAEDDVLDSDTQADLIAMGIASPVTKETAGARYHIELCRQLADFLQEPLNRASGLMPLTDVYCLFNRARGTELVSPDDLLAAAMLFQKVQLPLRLRTFPSGFTVIQNAAHSDDTVCAAIAQMVQPQQHYPNHHNNQHTPDSVATPTNLPPKASALPMESGKVTAVPEATPTPSAAFNAPPPPSTTTTSSAAVTAIPSMGAGGTDASSLSGADQAAGVSAVWEGDVAAGIVRMVDAQLGPGITAPDVARALRVATAIAAEHLLTAEARGVVCRDEGPEGTRFFRNFFRDAWPPLVILQ